MSGTEATTTDGETTRTTETRDDARSAAERLGGPIEDDQSRDKQGREEQSREEQSRDVASEAETDVGRRADLTGDEGDQSLDMTSEAEAVGRRSDSTGDEGDQGLDTASDAETDVGRRADSTGDEGDNGLETMSRAQTDADRQADNGSRQRATLIEPERAESYNSRWHDLKGEFVDDPRRAVRGANELVGEVLDELEELFRSQRAELEHGLDSEETTTEDLRQALGRYRSFFDRLLSF